MKKYGILVLLLVSFFSISQTQATSITIVGSQEELEKLELSRGEVFEKLSSYFDKTIPNTYTYIHLNFLDVPVGSNTYKSLQKLVYLDLIQNNSVKIHPDKKLNLYSFYKLSEKVFGMKLMRESEEESFKLQNVTQNDYYLLDYRLNTSLVEFKSSAVNKNVLNKKAILVDAYNMLVNEHIDNQDFDQVKMLEKAIEGFTSAAGDKHTVYFPPTDSKNFYESLNGEYQGIGAYVDMQKPGVLIITSPIKGSPSEKSGIKGGDRVIAVDDKKIAEEHSIQEVISWIKGPAGTVVTLTIERNGEEFKIDVIREKIIIKDIEYKVIDKNTFYIEIKSFGEHVGENFKEALTELSKRKNINKVIIDLRSNGGGYLGEVADMLSYFVEEGLPTAVVKYKTDEKNYYSRGYDLIDFSKYKLVLLENSGTASASEIMIGTIKDYYPDAVVIGENSYGKGSVQTIRQYNDGSSLKYTIAKWYTGKTQTGINGIGIAPDKEIEFDVERYRKWDLDNQLDEARYIQ